MNCRDYKYEDLKGKNYAIIEYVVEDNDYYIVSLHEDYDKAKKRLNHLRREAKTLFDKGIDSIEYGLYESTDERIKRCFNFEREDD